MKTILRSETKEVTISTDGPVALIGEKINPTGRKKLPQALREGDFDYVCLLIERQVNAGADLLDVNAGVPGMDEVALLPELVKFVASQTDLPLCIDTANPKALEAALKVSVGKPLVNSVSGEEKSMNDILPLVKEHGTAVIALALDDNGISNDAETRLRIAEKIINRAEQMGIPSREIVVDPLVMSVGADTSAAVVTCQTISLIREKLGVNMTMGASNISFGMPERHTLNQVFLALAINAGASCLITDPARLGMTIRASELLLGRDDYGRNYLTFYRNLEKTKKK
ncbi:MAG: dihydropteroate synthase [Anaerolineae bacterium]|jgi:5-methyltetrahydrofolate--homocysteine methyltransferase|nr:dihydropteroate synthase [Anaerolineae bacterium]MBT3712497.1 dihydropteroate synthase [Anaerolineae bacterium]MBT4311089.1 dihydropteroate synthase [Anaerolineae bacterium]MBT7191406.1 dihydropteroate synthase [Anaerolineae bacterium]MBT7989066.1 dihydropteroate synthase [Anaerolineae bacterium]